jgi:hypothetical protein
MLRALSLAMTMLVLPVEFALADAAPDTGGNAALKYWQAFATMPKLTDADQNRLAEYSDKPLDAQARESVSQAEYALQMMHRGAALRRCNWGITYEDGVFVRLPQANAARVLSTFARLRARMRFEEGRSAEAIDDLVAGVTLGRHVSLEGGFITMLVGYQIEHRLTETLALYLPRLDAKAMKDLETRLDALPPFGSQAKALLACERETLDWFIRKVKESKDKESLLAFLSWVGISEGKDRDAGEKARAFLQECGGTAQGVIKFAEEVRPCYDELARMLDLPLDQFEKQFEQESLKRAGNPVYKVFFPPLAKLRQSRARADVRRALLSAAIAVRLHGRDALKDHPDPVGGGLFEYAAFEGGFELSSKLKQQDDKPVTLTAGRRG